MGTRNRLNGVMQFISFIEILQQVFDAFEGDDYVKTSVEVSVRREDP